jgi:patatin-like phospholipase/acyl hydrolase
LAFNLVGDTRLGDLRQQIAIPTVNTTNQETKIFKSYDERDKDYKLVDVIIASSSAPRYFPAHEMTVLEKEEYVQKWFKDGGLSSNNPSDILLLEGLNKDKGFDKINILSITSGESKNVVTKAEKKGNLLSIPEMINEMLNLQDKKTDGTVRTLYKNLKLNGTYIRCEATIDVSSGEIDDVSDINMKAMSIDARLSLLNNKSKLDAFYLNTLT